MKMLIVVVFLTLEVVLAIDNSCMTVADLQDVFRIPLLPHGGSRSNILILTGYHTTQMYIEDIIKKYPRIRDLHNDPPYHTIRIHMARWIAYGINASLISLDDLNLCPEIANDFQNLPTLLGPVVSTVLLKTYKTYEKAKSARLRFGLKFPMALNFAFCDVIGQKTSYNFYSLLETLFGEADKSVWFYLGVSMLLVISLENYVIANKGEKFLVRNSWVVTMTAISVILSNGITGKVRKYSVLFVLWMFVSMIFVAHYSGEMASKVIRPSRVVRMTKIKQLVERNYSLLFDKQNFPVTLTKAAVEFSLTKNLSVINPAQLLNADILQMINKARVASTNDEFLKVMTIGWKHAVFVRWSGAVFAANRGNKYISENGIQKRRCFIGEELKYSVDNFYAFGGHNNEKLAKVAQILDESGFYALLWKEFFGLATSRRVQSRSRVIHPTRLQEDREQLKPLKFEGKLLDVFFLWMMCLGISTIALSFEIGGKRFKELREIYNLEYYVVMAFSILTK